jgi:lipoate-protein ligase A
MAMDEALAASLGEDEGVLRTYRWARPTLSLGRNQPARNLYDPFAIAGLGGEAVRRPTGGREILHDREVTYSVLLPVRALGGMREAYRILNGALVAALRSLGVQAELAVGVSSPALGSGPCFQEPSPGEVMVAGRKVAGSAQVRRGQVLLQHGSILLAPPSISLSALRMPQSIPLPSESSGITLAEILSQPVHFAGVAAAVESGMAGTLGGKWVRSEPSGAEVEVATSLLQRYQSPEWTWHR